MTDKKATREALGETLIELAAEGRDDIVVLDADLAKATTHGQVRRGLPGAASSTSVSPSRT